jgi:hypothetical protein
MPPKKSPLTLQHVRAWREWLQLREAGPSISFLPSHLSSTEPEDKEEKARQEMSGRAVGGEQISMKKEDEHDFGKTTLLVWLGILSGSIFFVCAHSDSQHTRTRAYTSFIPPLLTPYFSLLGAMIRRT